MTDICEELRMSRRKAHIRKICETIGSPSLAWAFGDPVNENIDIELISDFKVELIRILSELSIGNGSQLPSNTDPSGLPVFVAIEKISGGAAALYQLGYRPSWTSPVLMDEKYEVKFFMPDQSSISFRTGPDGGFSMYSLWLEMRILCGKNKESRPRACTQTCNHEKPNSRGSQTSDESPQNNKRPTSDKKTSDSEPCKVQ
ncbi:Hypothetical protein HVR_LOCUS766 [uncultured virus]|nr:Hypothetical protein HVR_LOCUS766 [uncultured virus]